MNKPFDLAVYDFNQSLVNLINSSGLPAVVLAQSLQNALTEVNKIAEQNLASARQAYEADSKKEE